MKLGFGLHGTLPDYWSRHRPASIVIHGNSERFTTLFDITSQWNIPVIVREWLRSTGDSLTALLQQTNGNAIEAADVWFRELQDRGLIKLWSNFRHIYVAHANEPPVNTVTERKAIAEFEKRRMYLLTNYTPLKACIYLFGVGNPDIRPPWEEQASCWNDLISTAAQAVVHGHKLGPHEYAAFVVPFYMFTKDKFWDRDDPPDAVPYENDVAGYGWFLGRMHMVIPLLEKYITDRYNIDAQVALKEAVIFTETGLDYGCANAKAKLWYTGSDYGSGGWKNCIGIWSQKYGIANTLEAGVEFAAQQLVLLNEVFESWYWCHSGAIFLLDSYTPDIWDSFLIGKYGIWDRVNELLDSRDYTVPMEPLVHGYTINCASREEFIYLRKAQEEYRQKHRQVQNWR